MSAPQGFTIASVQFELRAERSFAEFAAHVTEMVQRARAAGADLVVFPELVTTGLLAAVDGPVTTRDVARLYHGVFPAMTDEFVALVADLARGGVPILGGSHYRTAPDGSLRNTAVLAHPDGRVEYQDKLHLTPPEHALGAVGGDDVLVTSIGPFTAAVQICADIEFPEVSRHLVARGVDLILTPSLTWNRRGVARVRYGAIARAMENQLYVVTAPLVGTSGLPEDAPMHATGVATVAGPIDRTVGVNDGVLASGTDGGDRVVVAALDPGLLAASRARPEVPGLALRRQDLYRSLERAGRADEQAVPVP